MIEYFIHPRRANQQKPYNPNSRYSHLKRKKTYRLITYNFLKQLNCSLGPYNELVCLVAASIALDFNLKPHSNSLMYIARKKVKKYGNMSCADNKVDSLVTAV